VPLDALSHLFLLRGLQDLAKGVFFGQEGLKWSDINAADIYLKEIYIALILEAVGFLMLGLYFLFCPY